MTTKKIGFTGTRDGMSLRQKQALKIFLMENHGDFHHGDCIGADAEAHEIALECLMNIVIHPPKEEDLRAFCQGAKFQMRPYTYMVRNQNIVLSTGILIVAPKTDTEELRSGTWSTYRYAKKIGRPYKILAR